MADLTTDDKNKTTPPVTPDAGDKGKPAATAADDNKNKSALEQPQNEEKRELSDFEAAAEEGRKTAEANVAAEAKANGDAEPGAENKTAKVTTSEAQPQLKPEDEKGNVVAKKVDERTGDDKAAQKDDYGLKVGRATAKANLKTEESDAPDTQDDGTTYNQAIEEGQSTAAKNHRAEVAANKAANAR